MSPQVKGIAFLPETKRAKSRLKSLINGFQAIGMLPHIFPKIAVFSSLFWSFQSLPKCLDDSEKKPESLEMTGTGLAGLEPSTYRLGGGRSIHLSYSPS
jgi:hypothetical protein